MRPYHRCVCTTLEGWAGPNTQTAPVERVNLSVRTWATWVNFFFLFFCVHINICRVMLNVFLFIPILIVSVRSTLLVIDNKVWIELMHFALKYYSILTWCNEQVNERVNVRLVKIKWVCGLLRKAGTWTTTAEQRMAKMGFVLFCNGTCFAWFFFLRCSVFLVTVFFNQ